jgi:hypothetical protein
MRPDYTDIRALTDQEPLWFTIGGVPRYAPFHPSMLGVYDRSAVLVNVACQSCDAEMLIGDGAAALTLHRLAKGEVEEITIERFASRWTCGDPPRHNCPGSGETMSAVELEIIEAWERVDFDWKRRVDLEGAFRDE